MAPYERIDWNGIVHKADLLTVVESHVPELKGRFSSLPVILNSQAAPKPQAPAAAPRGGKGSLPADCC